jgi:hypothetical protein
MKLESENSNEIPKKNDGFSMPENYFSLSAQHLLAKIAWLEEHKDFPILSSINKNHGFSAPPLYFEQSGNRFELLPYKLLSNKELKKMPLSIPDAYFEKELLDTPTLSAIEKQQAFTVPETYFENNASRLYPKTKIISLFSKQVMYSIAALLVVCLGIWLIQAYSSTEIKGDCGTLACIDKTDLLKSNTMQSLDDDHLYDVVNAKALEEKLKGKNDTNKELANDSVVNDILDEQLDEL